MTTITKSQTPFTTTLNNELQTLRELTKHTAKTDAETGNPALKGDRLQDHINFIHTTCQSLLDKQAGELKPQSTLHATISNNKAAEKNIKNLLHKKGEAEQHKNQTANTLKNTLPPPKYHSRKWATWVIVILCLFEAPFSINLFESWGFTQLESYILSPLFAILFALIAHMTPKLIYILPNPKHKKILIATLLILFTIAFAYLGQERANYLTAHTGYSHSAVPFAVLSLLLLLSATLLSYFYLPITRGEKEAIVQYDYLKQEAEKAEHTFTTIEQDIAELHQQRITNERLSASTIEEGSINEHLILNTCKECIALYISTNKKHREHPSDCYTQSIDFQFRTHFLPLFDNNTNNPNNHENTKNL